MEKSKVHSERKVKNYLLLGLILLFVVFVFAVTIVRLNPVLHKAVEDSKAAKASKASENEEK